MISLQELEEGDKVSKKTLKSGVSPSKKMEDLAEEATTGDEDQSHPDSKDLKKVKENTSFPEEETN